MSTLRPVQGARAGCSRLFVSEQEMIATTERTSSVDQDGRNRESQLLSLRPRFEQTGCPVL